MDFLRVSDKKIIPYKNDSLIWFDQHQCKEFTLGFRDMDIHPHSHLTTPYTGNGVLGCYYYYPFTNDQLKELERQTMIYKYMIASIPVPFDLLVPSSSSFASPCNIKNKTGDPEPGRCRRTDGKKWRCSKEVVTNQKYCERHLHRGRPRSRKHVEPSYSRPINNGGSPKTRDLQNLPQKVSTRGTEMFCTSTKAEEENNYLNFIDVWSDGVRSSENQSTTSTSVSSSNGNLSLYSFDLSMRGNNLMGQEELSLIQMGLGVTGSGREDHHEYGRYGVSSLEKMSSWLAPMSSTPGGPLAEILRPNPNLATFSDIESFSLTATRTLSSSTSMKKMTGSVSDVIFQRRLICKENLGESKSINRWKRANCKLASMVSMEQILSAVMYHHPPYYNYQPMNNIDPMLQAQSTDVVLE